MTKKYLRLIFLSLISIMLILTVGCGNQGSEQLPVEDEVQDEVEAKDEPETESDTGELVKITYATGRDVTDATQKIVDEFNSLHEGSIEVEYVVMPNDTGKQHDMYVTAFSSGGTEYDVFDGDVIWPAEFSEADYIMPLDQLVERDGINLDDYMQGPVRGATFRGKLWALPRFIDTGMLYYRTDLFDEAPETWEDLIGLAEQAVANGEVEIGYVGQYRQYEGLVCNAIEIIDSYGGEVVDGNGEIIIDSPEVVKALEVLKEIASSDITPSNVTSFTEDETLAAFIEGKVAFARNWSYMWGVSQAEGSKVIGKTAMVPLPKGDVKSSSALGGWITMINKNTEHPEEAWEFLKFIAGPQSQKIMAIDGGQSPVLLSAYDDDEVLEAKPDYKDPGFIEGLKGASPRPVSPIYTKLSEIMQIEISKMISDQVTPEEAVKNMDELMKQEVEASK